MTRQMPGTRFARYADDIVIHCRSEGEANNVLSWVDSRMTEVGLGIHPEKTKVVWCKSRRFSKGRKKAPVKFSFLGFEFKPRSKWSRREGKKFLGYDCTVSSAVEQRKLQELRTFQPLRDTSLSLNVLMKALNPKLRGWQGYYGCIRYYELNKVFYHVEQRILKCVRKKYKLYMKGAASQWLAKVRMKHLDLFYHWTLVSGK